jgi:hypothetical protein
MHSLRICSTFEEWDGIATGYGLDDRGSIPNRQKKNFCSPQRSRPTLGPTQPPIQWALKVLSLRVKRPVREADRSHPSSTEVKNT